MAPAPKNHEHYQEKYLVVTKMVIVDSCYFNQHQIIAMSPSITSTSAQYCCDFISTNRFSNGYCGKTTWLWPCHFHVLRSDHFGLWSLLNRTRKAWKWEWRMCYFQPYWSSISQFEIWLVEWERLLFINWGCLFKRFLLKKMPFSPHQRKHLETRHHLIFWWYIVLWLHIELSAQIGARLHTIHHHLGFSYTPSALTFVHCADLHFMLFLIYIQISYYRWLHFKYCGPQNPYAFS